MARLNDEQRTVMLMLGAGWRYLEIAEQLGLEQTRVYRIVKAVRYKLRARSTEHALVLCLLQREFDLIDLLGTDPPDAAKRFLASIRSRIRR